MPPDDVVRWVKAHCSDTVLLVPPVLYERVRDLFEQAGEHLPANFQQQLKIPLAKRRR
jgi:hypothetical protein